MNFGTPTPVFYQIVVVLLLGFGAAFAGGKVAWVVAISMLASFLLFFAANGGFRSSETQMGLVLSALVMIPVAPFAVGLSLLGRSLRKRFLRRQD